jgi:hypothetical protein
MVQLALQHQDQGKSFIDGEYAMLPLVMQLRLE